MKRSALLGVKVAISLALLAYLFSITDLRALEERVRTADLLDLLAAVLCFVLMLALATWRWRMLLSALGARAPVGHLTASYLVATFFNNFLPSNIGGDIVRVRDSSKLTGLDRHLPGRRRHRPHPGVRGPLPARGGRLGPGAPHRARPRRGTGGAPRPRGAVRLPRLHLLPARDRALAHGRLAAELDRLGAGAVRGRAGRGARLPITAGDHLAGGSGERRFSRPSSSSTTWRSPAVSASRCPPARPS